MFYLVLAFIIALLIGMTYLVYFDQDEFDRQVREKFEEEGADYIIMYIYK